MDAILKYLREHKGYARMKDLKAIGFQTRDMRKLVAKGHLVKVKPGLYRLADIRPQESSGLVEVCLAMLASSRAGHDVRLTHQVSR